MTQHTPHRATLLGTNIHSGKPVWVTDQERQSGMYMLGVQGVGKSSELELLCYQDICKGYSVILFDPHGDSIEHVIAQMPQERLRSTYVLDLEDVAYPFGVNLFARQHSTHLADLQAVDRVMYVFEVLWEEVATQQHLPRYLRAASLALLQHGGLTLFDMYRFLQDDNFRQQVLQKVTDASVKQFWEYQYNNLSPTVRRKDVAPLVNRLEALFMGRSLVRNILGQTQTTIDFRYAIENKEIILIRLPVKTLPQDASLIGTMLIAQIHAAIFSFGDLPLERRPGFSLFIDEAQNFVTKSIEEMYTQGRKFGARVCLAHQFRQQLPDFLAEATLTARTIITFQTTPKDASVMASLYLHEEQTVKQEHIEPRVVEHLLTYGHRNEAVEHFVKHYLRPVQLEKKGNKLEVKTAGASLWNGTYPEVYIPFPFLNELLYKVEQERTGQLPLSRELLIGFSNCGKGFFNVLKHASPEELGMLCSPDPFVSPEQLTQLKKRLARSPEKMQLYDFLTTLRAVMLILSQEPLGKKQAVTPAEVAKQLVNLPRRTALVRVGKQIATIHTQDTPPAVSPSQLAQRKQRIQQQTRNKYCMPRQAVEQDIERRQQQPASQPLYRQQPPVSPVAPSQKQTPVPPALPGEGRPRYQRIVEDEE